MSHTIDFAGGQSRVLVSGAETDEAFSLLLNLQPPGNATPPHLHRRESETPFVLSGCLHVEGAAQTKSLEAGDAVVLVPDRPHRLSNRGAESTSYLLLCAPAGFERFVAAVGTPAGSDDDAPKAMTNEDRRRLTETAPAFGIDLLDESSLDNPSAVAPRVAKLEVMDVVGIAIEVLAETGTDDRDPVLLRATLPPGAAIPVHRHAEAEWFFVLAGRLDVHNDGRWRSGESGALLTVPSGAAHAIRNSGAVPATAICVTLAPLLRFFRDAGGPLGARPPGPPTPELMQKLLEIATAHGQSFGTPDEQAAAGFRMGPA